MRWGSGKDKSEELWKSKVRANRKSKVREFGTFLLKSLFVSMNSLIFVA